MQFRGLNPINLDDSGRMAVPSRYREVINGQCEGRMVVTIEPVEGNALAIYPLNEFEEIQATVESLPSLDSVSQRLKRLFIGHAADVKLDSSGRILIPPALRSYVKLDKRVMLVGQGKKFELWDEDRWNSKRDELLKGELAAGELSEGLRELAL